MKSTEARTTDCPKCQGRRQVHDGRWSCPTCDEDTTEQWQARTMVFKAAEGSDEGRASRLAEEYLAKYGKERPADPPCQWLGCTDTCPEPDGGVMFHCKKHTDEILAGLGPTSCESCDGSGRVFDPNVKGIVMCRECGAAGDMCSNCRHSRFIHGDAGCEGEACDCDSFDDRPEPRFRELCIHCGEPESAPRHSSEEPLGVNSHPFRQLSPDQVSKPLGDWAGLGHLAKDVEEAALRLRVGLTKASRDAAAALGVVLERSGGLPSGRVDSLAPEPCCHCGVALLPGVRERSCKKGEPADPFCEHALPASPTESVSVSNGQALKPDSEADPGELKEVTRISLELARYCVAGISTLAKQGVIAQAMIDYRKGAQTSVRRPRPPYELTVQEDPAGGWWRWFVSYGTPSGRHETAQGSCVREEDARAQADAAMRILGRRR